MKFKLLFYYFQLYIDVYLIRKLPTTQSSTRSMSLFWTDTFDGLVLKDRIIIMAKKFRKI